MAEPTAGTDKTAKTRDRRHTIGSIGEAAVRECIAAWNWYVVDYNVRWRDGELDIIAVDNRTLVFIEVKTLRAKPGSDRPAFSPFESIGDRKRAQIRKLAKRWVSDELRRQFHQGQRRFEEFRFDAFAVTVDAEDNVTSIEHLEDAF